MLLCENHTEPVLDVSYMNGVSDKFATCSEDGSIRLWDSNDYSVISRCTVQTAGLVFPNCATFTDEVIISGWNDGKIRSFRVEGSTPLWQIDNAHKNGVSALCLSYNSKFICSGGNEGECRVWEIRSRELVSHLKEHTSRVTKV
jgi:WD40 repeat protein